MEDGKRLETEAGTVQGGLISPVLANVYLHYTLDTWFDYIKKREFRGEMYMVRYLHSREPAIIYRCFQKRYLGDRVELL